MVKKLIAWCIAVILLCCNTAYATEISSDKETDVIIQISEIQYENASFRANVRVVFHNIGLYNPTVHLSYHLFDEHGAMMPFEFARFPVSIDENGVAEVAVSGDCYLPEEYADHLPNAMMIGFDLVDQQNAYWFSGNDTVVKEFPQIPYEGAICAGKSIVENIPREGAQAPSLDKVSLALNGFTWIAAAALTGTVVLRKAAEKTKR